MFVSDCAIEPKRGMPFVSRDWRLYWNDMTAAAEKVVRYTSGMDARSFSLDEKTRDAVLRNLEIIGEAVKRWL